MKFIQRNVDVTAWTVVFAVVGTIAILVNSLTLLIFIKTKALRTRKHVMIINLCVADLLFLATGIPLYVIHQLKPSSISFLMLHVLSRLSKLASVITLAVIAVERMHATVRPLRHKLLSSRVFIRTVELIWISAAILTTIITLEITGVLNYDSIASILVPSITFGVIAVIVSSYVIIWISFHRRRRQNLGDLIDQEREKALAVTLLLVSGSFMVTWSPPMLYLAITRVCSDCVQPGRTDIGWVFLLFAIQCLINPIIYCLRLPMFKVSLKTAAKRIYFKCFRRSFSTPVGQSSSIHPEIQLVKTAMCCMIIANRGDGCMFGSNIPRGTGYSTE